MFCAAENCELPAFGCAAPCLSSHNHGKKGLSSRLIQWSAIESEVRRLIDGSPTEEDLEVLKKQEKMIMVMIDELR